MSKASKTNVSRNLQLKWQDISRRLTAHTIDSVYDWMRFQWDSIHPSRASQRFRLFQSFELKQSVETTWKMLVYSSVNFRATLERIDYRWNFQLESILVVHRIMFGQMEMWFNRLVLNRYFVIQSLYEFQMLIKFSFWSFGALKLSLWMYPFSSTWTET